MEIRLIGEFVCNACGEEWHKEHLFDGDAFCGLCSHPLQAMVYDRLTKTLVLLPEDWKIQVN